MCAHMSLHTCAQLNMCSARLSVCTNTHQKQHRTTHSKFFRWRRPLWIWQRKHDEDTSCHRTGSFKVFPGQPAQVWLLFKLTENTGRHSWRWKKWGELKKKMMKERNIEGPTANLYILGKKKLKQNSSFILNCSALSLSLLSYQLIPHSNSILIGFELAKRGGKYFTNTWFIKTLIIRRLSFY